MKADYKFGDPIWVNFGGHDEKEAIFVNELYGCASIVHGASSSILRVSFDLIRPREITGTWVPTALQKPTTVSTYLVSVLDNSADTPFRYVTVGWMPEEFKDTNKWIVGDEIVNNVEAWMMFPKCYNPCKSYCNRQEKE